MDILKQDLAPISQKAWDEINAEAKNMFSILCTSRKFVNVSAPKGWDFAAVSSGKLIMPEKNKNYGYFDIQPLIELRIPFKLNKFELDNITRGLEDVDLENMEKAAKELAKFEDMAIFNGFEKTGLPGLKKTCEHDPVAISENIENIAESVSEGISILNDHFVQGPFHLVVNKKNWNKIQTIRHGYPLAKHLKDILGGNIIKNMNNESNYLVSASDNNLLLTVGQDISIGYEHYNEQDVSFYFTETFAFQINDPAAFIEII